MTLNDTTRHNETDTQPTNGNGQAKDKEQKPQDPGVLLAEMKAQIEELQRKFSLARGTQSDIQAPKPEPRKLDLVVRVEQVLRTQVCTTEELARTVGEPIQKVQEKLKTIRKHLADVGTPEQARWVWRIGDDTPAKELRDLVARLIEGHAMTTAELAKITGARMARVNGVLVDLQRTPEVPIYNLGSNFRAKWLILPKNAKPANLPPKAVKSR